MKKLLLLLFLGCCGVVWAQTNATSGSTNAPAAKKIPQPTQVDSDKAEFDMGGPKTPRMVYYRGNVKVNDPKMALTCELLSANLSRDTEGRTNRLIVAETNVVLNSLGDNGEQFILFESFPGRYE